MGILIFANAKMQNFIDNFSLITCVRTKIGIFDFNFCKREDANFH